MLGHPGRGRHQIDDFVGDFQGFDGTESQPLQRLFLKQPSDQTGQPGAGVQVPSVASQMDAGQYDFLVALMQQVPRLPQHLLQGKTARVAAHKRNHAVGTPIAAAVLHLQKGPGPASPRHVGNGPQLPGLKDAAAVNLGAAGQAFLRLSAVGGNTSGEVFFLRPRKPVAVCGSCRQRRSRPPFEQFPRAHAEHNNRSPLCWRPGCDGESAGSPGGPGHQRSE